MIPLFQNPSKKFSPVVPAQTNFTTVVDAVMLPRGFLKKRKILTVANFFQSP